MKKYEVMFIVKPTLSEEEVNAVVNKYKKVLTDNNASVTGETDMGQRELAYEIKSYKTGYYFLFVIESENDEAIKEFDRVALINENIIRHLIVKSEER